ncbi:GNAT family N-acetyltransferase [Candidatus Gottesmanbacteria bacterium]|nr:GNAT family N-acetyltransferase [Candidatus Gottesmanbacteria bacterium]
MQPGQIIKTFKSKKGNTVVIRYPKWEDLDDLVTFANNLVKEDTFIMLNKEITKEEESKWLSETINQIEEGKKIQLAAVVNGKFAANCEIRIRDKKQTHVGEIGISVALPYRQDGIGNQLLSTLIEEGKKAGLKLLIIHCFENNDRALHLYKKLGFTRSGLVPGVYAYKGAYVGEVTLFLSIK